MRLWHSAFAALAALAVVMLSAAAFAQPKEGSPLVALGGNWSGNGTINFKDGNKERIRCRADYTPDAAGANMKIGLVCASDSYKFDLSADVQYQNGNVSGMWNEKTRAAAGNLSGRATPGHITVNAVGQTFAAVLNINTRGSSQSVKIEAPGTTMSEVAITLAKK
jgi:hypothetical protein